MSKTPATSPLSNSAGNNRLVTYESLLDSSLELTMKEGSLFFQESGSVHETMRRIAARLDELKIPYAVVGGMALMAYGFRRFTEDVDILVTAESIARIHEELEGRGYLPPFANSRHLRDTQTHVKVEFLVSGGYPGDGKPKPVVFPDPELVTEMIDGIRFIKLSSLIELKLASGMTAKHRGKDITDVEELISALKLPESLADQLNAFVRDKYRELWRNLRYSEIRYLRQMSHPHDIVVRSLADLTAALPDSAEEIRTMEAAGVQLDSNRATPGEALLFTYDRIVADKHEMQPESDFLRLPPDRAQE